MAGGSIGLYEEVNLMPGANADPRIFAVGHRSPREGLPKVFYSELVLK